MEGWSRVQRRVLLLALLLQAPARIAVSQSDTGGCPTQPSCNAADTACLGFGNLAITCSNGTKISSGQCYLTDICDSVAADQGNDWIRVTANNINPQQCYAYSGQIRQNLYAAYNTWCCQGENYLKCCPGSTGWPTGVSKTADNCAAMRNSSDVVYAGAAGTSARTVFLIRLAPPVDSVLCQLLVYNTSGSVGVTVAAASTTTTAASTTTTTASSTGSSAATTTAPAVTTASVGRRRRRRDVQDKLRARRVRRATGSLITLDEQTVKLLIVGMDVSSLVISAVTTASSGSVTVTVTAEQNVAPASTLSPDKRSNSWIVATGSICGLVAALLVAYLVACGVHSSKSTHADKLPL